MLLPDVVEEAHLDARAPVVEHERHARTAPAHLQHEAGDRHVLAAAEALLRLRPRPAEVHDARRRDLPQLLLVFGDRMAGQEQAERLALALQPLRLAPLRKHRDLDRRAFVAGDGTRKAAEEVVLPRGMGARALLAELDRGRQHLGERGARRAEAVEAAGFQHRLERALARKPEVHAPAEVDEVAERALALALADDRLDRALADALDRAEAIADRAGPCDGECEARGVHVGRLHVEAEAGAFVDEGDDLVRVLHVAGKHGRHEGLGIMRLQPCGLVREERVGHRVRLVEAVTRELLDQVEDVAGAGRRHAASDRAVDEHRPLERPSPRASSCPSRGAAGPRRRACIRRASARSASPVPGTGSRRRSASGSRRGSGAGSRSCRPSGRACGR